MHDPGVGGVLGRVIASLLLAALGACFNPSYQQAQCSPEGDCPDGYSCVADVCVRDPGSGDDDAGPDGSVDAPPVSTVPSCIGLPRTCGVNFNDDCCASLPVPIEVYQGNHDVTTKNRRLGRFVLGDLKIANRGVAKVEVAFTLDANGILEVTAEEVGTGKAASVQLEASSGLSADEIAALGRQIQRVD